MSDLLAAIAEVVRMVSPEKVRAIAAAVRKSESSKATGWLSGIVGTAAAASVVDQLIVAWRATTVGAEELGSMLLAASYVVEKAAQQQKIELVWTGPTTPFVSARRTEQALLQVINSAEQRLFITSFVAYDVSTIVNALNAACDRGVIVSMLLELSQAHGGSITFDAIGKMRTLVPSAKLFAWREKSSQFSDGCVHAKVAVADGQICFITSANLTGHAMEKNMEAGVLISGGEAPRQLDQHLGALVGTSVVSPV